METRVSDLPFSERPRLNFAVRAARQAFEATYLLITSRVTEALGRDDPPSYNHIGKSLDGPELDEIWDRLVNVARPLSECALLPGSFLWFSFGDPFPANHPGLIRSFLGSLEHASRAEEGRNVLFARSFFKPLEDHASDVLATLNQIEHALAGAPAGVPGRRSTNEHFGDFAERLKKQNPKITRKEIRQQYKQEFPGYPLPSPDAVRGILYRRRKRGDGPEEKSVT